MSTRAGLDIFLRGGEGEAEGNSLCLYETGVGIGSVGPEAVIEVGNVKLEAQFSGKAMEGIKEG